MIEFIEHNAIDKQEWNQLNERSGLGSYYNQAAVLDIASPGWHALIDRSTGHQMPLTHRKKFGFYYLFQPVGLQRLGVFGPEAASHLQRFLEAIPEQFTYWDIRVPMAKVADEYEPKECINMSMSLGAAAEELAASFSKNHRRNLQGVVPEIHAISSAQFMQAYTKHAAPKYGISEGDLDIISNLLSLAEQSNSADIRGIKGCDCAAALIKWRDQLIFFKSVNDDEGRKQKGLFHLLQAVVNDYAGGSWILDFAGSNNENIQRFYRGFGAQPAVYLSLKYNALPFPFRFFK